METAKIKSNSKYQKAIERSFEVIYHNLKRIRENTSLEGVEGKRRHSQPELTANPVSQRRYPLSETFHSLRETLPKTMGRRVSFSDSTIRI